jgi:hypothetical protein
MPVAPDFLDLFRRNSPWTQAASHGEVFKIYPQFVLSASDADLKSVIVGLQQRNIALALEFGLLTNPTLCGKIEGYCGEQIGPAAARVKALGGTLAYVAMDEPLWFGHLQQGTSIAAMAPDVAHQVATLYSVFPNCQVGENEPLPSAMAPSDWAAQIGAWQAAYRAATGIPLSFFHAEVIWPDANSRAQMLAVAADSRAGGTRFGIIYDGNTTDPTGVAWTTDAEDFFSYIEQTFIPDDAILQTWAPQPDHALPETQPGTMTYLVNRYMAAETILSAQRTSDGFLGGITSQGLPLSNAQISVYAITETGWQSISAGPTNASGMFELKLSAPIPVVKFDFTGDSTHRLSWALAWTP